MAMSACYSFSFGPPTSICSSMQTIIEDSRLKPILDKVVAQERLSSDDGVTLYQSPDILAVGHMANLVRERLHGNTTDFNVNRHINPTDCSVAGCPRSPFGNTNKDPKPSPISLHQLSHATVTRDR